MDDEFSLTILFRPAMDVSNRQWIEEQLEEALEADELGVVSGGGTALDGSTSDIGLDLIDLERGLAVVRRVLAEENVPLTTTLICHQPKLVKRKVWDCKIRGKWQAGRCRLTYQAEATGRDGRSLAGFRTQIAVPKGADPQAVLGKRARKIIEEAAEVALKSVLISREGPTNSRQQAGPA
jgi:hypothetical protein